LVGVFLIAIHEVTTALTPGIFAVGVLIAVLTIFVPAVGLLFQSRVKRSREGAVIVGDEPENIAGAADSVAQDVIGYVRLTSGSNTVRLTDGAGESQVLARSPAVKELEEGAARLNSILSVTNPSRVVLAFSEARRGESFAVLEKCYKKDVPVVTTGPASSRLLTDSVTHDGFVEVLPSPLTQRQELAKRSFDIVFAILGIVVVAPLVPVIALTVRLDSRGAVIYRQIRTEQFGATFVLPKFRTMVENAESETGAVIRDDDKDPRITAVWRFLRATYLDEIPQLFSILLGRMSAVGPRPERPELDSEWKQDEPAWPRRWHVKPGLTGFAQVDFDSFDEGQYPTDNLAADDRYMNEWSLWLDCKLIGLQFSKLFEKFGGD